jgi:hypothetical protein
MLISSMTASSSSTCYREKFVTGTATVLTCSNQVTLCSLTLRRTTDLKTLFKFRRNTYPSSSIPARDRTIRSRFHRDHVCKTLEREAPPAWSLLGKLFFLASCSAYWNLG